MNEIQAVTETLLTRSAEFVPRLLLAIVILIVGIWLTGRLVRLFRETAARRALDPNLVPFISALIRVVLLAMLVISVAGMVGVATTSFVAVLGAAGLAVGLGGSESAVEDLDRAYVEAAAFLEERSARRIG